MSVGQNSTAARTTTRIAATRSTSTTVVVTINLNLSVMRRGIKKPLVAAFALPGV